MRGTGATEGVAARAVPHGALTLASRTRDALLGAGKVVSGTDDEARSRRATASRATASTACPPAPPCIAPVTVHPCARQSAPAHRRTVAEAMETAAAISWRACTVPNLRVVRVTMALV